MLLGRRIAFGGIASALIVLLIAVSSVSPTADFALYSLTSLCMAVVLMETGIRSALISYAASSLLLFFLFGFWYALPFWALFGLYPVLKALVEKQDNSFLSYLGKTVYFAAVVLAGIFLFGGKIRSMNAWIFLKEKFSLADSGWTALLAVLAGTAILWVYDYALTLLIHMFQKRLGRFFRR